MNKGFGKVQKKILAYLEDHREAFRSTIVFALRAPTSKYYYNKSKSTIEESIKSLLDDKVLLVGSENKDLRAIGDWDYRCKYPKRKVVRINKENPRYKNYYIGKKSGD